MFTDYSTIKKMALDELIPGETYITIGLDMECFPCVHKIKFLENRGDKILILSDDLRILEDAEYASLYENSETNLIKAKQEILDYCRINFPWRFNQ